MPKSMMVTTLPTGRLSRKMVMYGGFPSVFFITRQDTFLFLFSSVIHDIYIVENVKRKL